MAMTSDDDSDCDEENDNDAPLVQLDPILEEPELESSLVVHTLCGSKEVIIRSTHSDEDDKVEYMESSPIERCIITSEADGHSPPLKWRNLDDSDLLSNDMEKDSGSPSIKRCKGINKGSMVTGQLTTCNGFGVPTIPSTLQLTVPGA
ncbi:hypothetical protein K439DRAFT_1618829 [Ramaria rubella]|nr:hypothetical protein K439DRAFT_1618829 [Ramaria rubella]